MSPSSSESKNKPSSDCFLLQVVFSLCLFFDPEDGSNVSPKRLQTFSGLQGVVTSKINHHWQNLEFYISRKAWNTNLNFWLTTTTTKLHYFICMMLQIFFFIILSVVRLSPLVTAATTDLLYQPQMTDDADCGAIGGMKYSEKTCPSATLSTTNPKWRDPGSKPGRRGGKPATNRLSYGADLMLRILQCLTY
jgi:hypothetical protein